MRVDLGPGPERCVPDGKILGHPITARIKANVDHERASIGSKSRPRKIRSQDHMGTFSFGRSPKGDGQGRGSRPELPPCPPAVAALNSTKQVCFNVAVVETGHNSLMTYPTFFYIFIFTTNHFFCFFFFRRERVSTH